ncbi:MAG TPA: hypothetical protein VGR45_03830 [Stellaceae bacterium]|nr:hypothetical protein [Stellaceae bacterium]
MDDLTDYTNSAAIVRKHTLERMVLWLDSSDRALTEAGFHRKCLDHRRKTLDKTDSGAKT